MMEPHQSMDEVAIEDTSTSSAKPPALKKLSLKNLGGSQDEAPRSPRKLKGLGLNLIRRTVSKNKRRLTEGEFDLDMTYINPNIVAMGFPSLKVEGLYRNKMTDVQAFVNTNHPNHYWVYNLCSERAYEESYFDGRVSRFPFHDHNPPPFNMMLDFCRHAYAFLSQDPENTVFIHCKAGKGRTGLMICVYLVFSEAQPSAADALTFYGEARTKDGKGVTIPSQQRYIHYFDQRFKELGGRDTILRSWPGDMLPEFPALSITRIVMSPCPEGGGVFTFVVRRPGKWHYAEDETKYRKGDVVDVAVADAFVRGDIDVHCMAKGKEKAIFHFWFNTAFIQNNYLLLRKKELDGAVKDKKHAVFDEDFKVELYFSAL